MFSISAHTNPFPRPLWSLKREVDLPHFSDILRKSYGLEFDPDQEEDLSLVMSVSVVV